MQSNTEQLKRDEAITNAMADMPWLSFSSLKAFSESPKSFIDYKIQAFQQTDSMKFGNVVHTLILEPLTFYDKYWILNDREKIAEIGGARPRTTKAYKEWHQELTTQNAGKEVVNVDDFELAMNMKTAVMLSPAHDLITGCTDFESKIHFEEDGVNIVGYIDGKAKTYLLDLKTCQDANPQKTSRDIFNMKYHVQAGIYCEAEGIMDYYIIYVDQKCNVSIHKLSDEVIAKGISTYKGWLRDFDRCREQNAWEQSYEFYTTKGYYETHLPPWEK